VAREAHTRGYDGIVCGHIHCAEIRTIGEITYYNDGDWVESCTALAEDAQGAIRIIDWSREMAAEHRSLKDKVEPTAELVPAL
jgi:UDP-2,3-diacylglucosamine pyrophosphatase LpxH